MCNTVQTILHRHRLSHIIISKSSFHATGAKTDLLKLAISMFWTKQNPIILLLFIITAKY